MNTSVSFQRDTLQSEIHSWHIGDLGAETGCIFFFFFLSLGILLGTKYIRHAGTHTVLRQIPLCYQAVIVDSFYTKH